jgi:putative phosphoribosyl transferase
MDIKNNGTRAKVRIISRSSEPFQDREQAGQLLARELSNFSQEKAVVIGIPRGGLLVAQSLAENIGAELDIVISRKLGTPGQSELAMGAVAEDGEVFLNQDITTELAIPEALIEQEKERQLAEIKRRIQLIRRVKSKVPLQGRTVIVTDDGVATGATMQVAVWALRQENPRKLIAALPVASDEAVARLAQVVEELICLRMPTNFMAVGQFYLQFAQVTDEQVLDILRKEKIKGQGPKYKG